MFRIEFFVKDTKLAELLRSLDGVAYQLQVHPVADQLPSRAKRNGSASEAEGIRAAILSSGLGKFKVADIVKLTGCESANVRSAMIPMIREGALRKVEYGTYVVKGAKV